MQTFLPFFSFFNVAKCLDKKRLNKQIVEACQILDILKKIDNQGRVIITCDKTPAWVHHPAVLMWIGYENSLKFYIWACVNEWEYRYNKKRKIVISKTEEIKPIWLTKKVVMSHRSNLIRKSDFYTQYKWNVGPELPYFWPFKWSKEENKRILIDEAL